MKIYDGRASLYQWDLGVKVTSETLAEGDEVHFCHVNRSAALVVKAHTLDGAVVADVPDVLLQKPYPLIAYRYIIGEDEGHRTIEEYEFKVVARPRPEDYVYTPEQQFSIEAAVNAALGDRDQKFDELERTVQDHDEQILSLQGQDNALNSRIAENEYNIGYNHAEITRLEFVEIAALKEALGTAQQTLSEVVDGGAFV